MEEIEGACESRTGEACYCQEGGGPARWVSFARPKPEIFLQDTIHCPEVIMEFAREIGAVYKGRYIVRVGDGRPCLYTKKQLRVLMHG